MTSASGTAESPAIRSSIPARIDRLPWSRFHTRMVIALGVAWVLDGLEITIAANVVADLTQKSTLNLSAGQAADIATWYLVGEVIGALFFGHLSDKLGRRNLFMITLGVYLIGSGLTAATVAGGGWVVFLYATRIIAGMGIGGEYAAINSAIDEMIPARYRGRVDIAVNGTYWAGSIIGTIATLFLLNHLSANLGWRLAFLLGPVLSLCIIYVRRNLPESPRWQIMHGREQADRGQSPSREDVAASPRTPSAAMLLGRGDGQPVPGAHDRSTLSLRFTFAPIFLRPGADSISSSQPHRGPGWLATDARPVRHAGQRKKMIAAFCCPATWPCSDHRHPVQAGHAERDQTIAWAVIFFFASPRERRVPDRQRGVPAGGPGQARSPCSSPSRSASACSAPTCTAT